MTIYLKQMPLGPMENFVYLIGDPQTKEAAVVDPAWNVPAILQQVADDGYRLTHVLLTHGHYDHIDGTEDIVEKTDATVVVGERDLNDLMYEGAGGLVIPRSRLKKISHEDTVRLGRVEIRVLRTPGHTPGSQCYVVKDPSGEAVGVMTGDTLFIGTIGRCDFPYSNPQEMYKSLGKIKALGDQVTLYTGHDYGSSPTNTIGREKKTNPYLMAGSLEEFVSMVRR